MGAFTLEALGLVLDPLKRELKPLPLLLAILMERDTISRTRAMQAK